MRAKTLSLVAVLAAIGPTLAPAGELPTKDDLLASWDANWDRASDLEVSYALFNAGSAEASALGIVAEAQFLLRYDGIHVYSECFNPATGMTQKHTYDQISQRGCVLNPGPRRPQGNMSAAGFGVPAALWLTEQFAPLEMAYFDGSHQSLRHFLLSPTAAVRAEPEDVDGISCVVVDFRQTSDVDSSDPGATVTQTTFWLDPARSTVPLRTVTVDAAGRVMMTREFRDYRCVDGVWLPLTICTTGGEAGRFPGLTATRRVIMDGDAPRLRINTGLGDGECVMRFPPGTLVIDDDQPASYVVNGAGELVPIDDYLASSGGGIHHRRVTAVLASPSRRAVGQWVAVALGLALGLVLGLLPWRARR